MFTGYRIDNDKCYIKVFCGESLVWNTMGKFLTMLSVGVVKARCDPRAISTT